MPHALGYARVSTPNQDISGQLARLKDAGAQRTFHDVVSGKTFERPSLAALMDYAREGDALMVVRLDRLGRSLKELLRIVDEMKERGVALVSLEEKIDTSSAAGELVFHVFGAIAQFERRLIAERTRNGIKAALPLVQSGLSPTEAAKQVGLGRSTVYRELAASIDAQPNSP